MKSERQGPDHLDPCKKNDKEFGFILSVTEKPLEDFQFINKGSVFFFMLTHKSKYWMKGKN